MKTGFSAYSQNIREMDVMPGDAVDVTDTKMLSGLAEDTIDFNENNNTGEYTTGKPSYGPLGATGRH